MRRAFTIMTVILFSAVFAMAQGPRDRDDHNDGGPIQAGYAVVTPVAVTTGSGTGGTTVTTGSTSGGTTVTTGTTTGGTTNTTGLAVFETFGLREGGATTQAGVLPPDLTTNAMLFVDSDGQLSKNLGVAIVNPNSTNVNVSLTLKKSDGTSAATGTLNVPSHQQVSKMVTELFSGSSIPPNVTGTLVITSAGSSSLPVSVIGLRFRGANFSTIPATNLSGSSSPLPNITANAGGPGAILLPQFAAGGGWATELVMVNTSSSPMAVRVDLFKQDGTPLTTALNGQTGSSFTNINIPAGGVAVFAPRDNKGDDDF
ncbi:MAG TPA: hypothetical protein VKY31_16210 [Terriglobia bacterium]|nr:hypothetical protein [Terriglobia bacterium]